MNLPARFGKYELIEFLGGGMSHVYRATDTLIGRQVAVKVLTPESASDPEVKDRFLLEARMAGNISHENIVNIYDFGEIDGLPFLVMEFLQGDTLHSLIQGGRAGDIRHKLEIALRAARALGYIHSQQVIHRDVKPDNIHVSGKGIVKLIDFGIAKVENVTRTRPGFVLGTPYYMAPEQVRGDKTTPLVDVYAFGVLLFELFAGVKPFKADNVEQIFYQILNVPFDFAALRQAGVPQPVIDLIAQCVAKDPAARPSGFRDICARLEDMIAPEPGAAAASRTPGTAPPAGVRAVEPPRSSRTLLYAGAAVLTVVGVAGLYLVLNRSKAPAAEPIASKGVSLANIIDTSTGQMILIPAGSFLSGPDRQQISVPDYYIDKTEVTNGAYEQYCKARGRPLPPDFSETARANPVANITLDDARDFSSWAGKRLPTMVEWEKAARGTDGSIYPWGNEQDASFANLAQNGTPGMLRPAAQADRDVSPWGVLDMAGNVSEFVDQLRTPSPAAVERFARLVQPPPASNEAWYTFRGGSYRLPLAAAIAYEWGAIPARFHGPDLGFRCVRDAGPAKLP
jgi:eukaryotic-like serine/threonine-protein kinase